MWKSINALIIFFSFILCFQAYSQRPYRSPLEGELQRSNWTIGKCAIASLTVKYSLSTIAGQPTVFTNIRWKPTTSLGEDWLANENPHLLLQIYSGQTSSYYFLPADGALGLIPKGNNTYGYNPISGSPNWDQLFTRTATKNPNTNDWNFISADEAKRIWSHDFQVSGFILVID